MELDKSSVIKALDICANDKGCAACEFNGRNARCIIGLQTAALEALTELSQAHEMLSESYDHLEKTKDELLENLKLANADKIIAERKEKDARALFMEVSNTLQERRWVSVHEKLPEESGKYLVCTQRGNVYQTKFYSYPESRGGHWGQKDKGRSITHWMRLPEAPKTGGEK